MNQSADCPRSDSCFLVGICCILILSVIVVFGSTIHHGFAGEDDDQNITLIPQVTGGLSVPLIGWSLSHTQMMRWTPIATISRQVDCQLFGLWAGGHHLTSLFLHACASMALLFALRSLTGAIWRSAFVAALFAIHPLHVEPVAWLSARSEVLGGLFFSLTLLAYAKYARRGFSWMRYGLVMFLFALALMSKPMVVTLPCVLILIDYWPLGRLKKSTDLTGLLLEKAPLFALSCIMGIVALVGQKEFMEQLSPPIGVRLSTAVISSVIYIKKMVWPSCLSVYYTLPEQGWPLWQVILSIVSLALLVCWIVIIGQKKPYFTVGWLWYFVMLVPVSGLVQMGGSLAYADRYTYIPMIGPSIAMTWLVSDWSGFHVIRRRFLAISSFVLLGLLAFLAYRQVHFWKDNITNWQHVAECTYANELVHNNLGNAYLDAGRVDEATAEFYKALEINSSNTQALVSLAYALLLQGRSVESESMSRRALLIDPRDAHACNNLGNALLDLGRNGEAEAAYREAVMLRPNDAGAHYNLGNALFIEGRNDEAIQEYREALRIYPAHRKAYQTLGDALIKSGIPTEALSQYRQALRINPADAELWHKLGKLLYQQGSRAEGIRNLMESLRLQVNANVRNDLAWMLSTAPEEDLRDGKKALEMALQAYKGAGGNDPVILDTLAAAYAETGDYSKALETARKALALAEQEETKDLSASLKEEITLYEAGKPCRDPR